MIHQVLIRDLNTLGNQLPQGSMKKDVQAFVLNAVKVKLSHLPFDDEFEGDNQILKGIEAAKILEKEANKGKRNISPQKKNTKTPNPWKEPNKWYLPI